MEKDVKSTDVDIVIKNEDGYSYFEIKEPKMLQRALMNDIRLDFSLVKEDTVIIYPDQRFIQSQRVFIGTNTRIL